MYFKSLELFGFKSFAERTVLDFEPGVTAIVGPNGCGKSNLSDSIKWVLGEQSVKALRGGKMEDVIFNGTDIKEPVNFAEVSLVLSNQDRVLPIEYDEVTITRRLYRSGESEYLLNKTPVRLKDISELFMGTGIGTSAYSLIEQGRIDQVLSSRPEERREVFEEASGITKYKAKKKEALRRLEETENNLVRINDIISEVKRQISSIERQAKKAERYKERYEELKEAELKLSRIELEALREKYQHSDVGINDFKVKEERIESELNRLREYSYNLNSEKTRIETMRVELKSGVIEIDSEISRNRDRLSLDRERIEELTKRRMDLEDEARKATENIALQEKELSSLREKVLTLETEDDVRIKNLSDNEKKLEEISKAIKINETTISTSKANIIDIALRQAKLRNHIARISTTISTHGARLKRLETERQAVMDEKNSLDIKRNEALNDIELMQKDVSGLREEKDAISRDISDITNRISELLEKSRHIHGELATNKSRLEILEEARIKYEGYSSGVKSILGKRGTDQPKIDGVMDCLANLLNVKKGYEIAIESALGKYLQSIVVNDIDAAEKAVSYLREHSLGSASFINMQHFNSSTVKLEDAVWINYSGALSRAIDFVNVEDAYKNILRHILHDVFIVKDIETLRAILSQNPEARLSTFITIEGDVFSNGYISCTTSIKEDLSLINRDARINEVSQLIIELEKMSYSINEERSNKEKDRDELNKKFEVLTANLNEKESLLNNTNNRRINIEENIKGITDEISLVNLEIDEVSSELLTLRQEEKSSAESLSRIEEENHVNEERMRRSEQLISDYLREREGLLVEIAKLRSELGTLEGKKEGLANTLNILENSFRDMTNSLESRKIEMDSSLKKIGELKKEISIVEEKIELLSGERVKKNAGLEEVEKTYSSVIEKLGVDETSIRQLEKEINEVRVSLHSVDLKKTEFSYAMDNLKQRIKDVYKVDLDDVQIPDDWRGLDVEQLKKGTEEKRSQVDSMGAVNLVAIEEHTELQERFVFLTNQRDDLLKAKDSLLKAIDKINRTTKELFIETFKNIQDEFRNFFKMLFGGGDGELMLLDEGNVLECGIEIIARPPGKRFQNVSLLSGGERALSAIALIFAIFKVKPSPFCVLDEIDAALDESNVDRFSRSLDMFTKTSQFIVITHNKRTIDRADVMYGITMQESGISKVVSVKFSDAKKQEAAAVGEP